MDEAKDETKGDCQWICHEVVEHIDTLNKIAGAVVVDHLIKTDSNRLQCVSACAAHTP